MAGELLRNYTREVVDAIKKEGWDGEDEDGKLQWSYAGSLLFSVTVITTIGKHWPHHLLPKLTVAATLPTGAAFACSKKKIRARMQGSNTEGDRVDAAKGLRK